VCNLDCTPTALGAQSWREITCDCLPTKRKTVEYRCTVVLSMQFLFSRNWFYWWDQLACCSLFCKQLWTTKELCKIWGFHGSLYEECRLLRYKNPVRTSQETHYVSATESNQLMLCNIWGFHGGDCEECPLLGYKNPVRTSQETHYVSATESSQLMLCKIWGFHGTDYEECYLLGFYGTWFLS
jgi:hypothetical protein